VTFKRCLLNKCQEEFERTDRYEETMGLDAAAKASKMRHVRNRMLGIIKFIGELFAQQILNEKIMHDSVKRLLDNMEEDTIECLCTLMATIGQLLDRKEARHYMDYYFDQMKKTANEIGSNPAQYPWGVRLRVMILDTIDLRKNRYVLPFVLVVCLAHSAGVVPLSLVPCIHVTEHKHTHTHTHTQHTHNPAHVICV
jgi:hypothetical protein